MEMFYRKRRILFMALFLMTVTGLLLLYMFQIHICFWLKHSLQLSVACDQLLRHQFMAQKLNLMTANCRDSCVWTITSAGRLGNQMGEYATLYALAKLTGNQAYIMPEMYNWLSPIFKINLPVLSKYMIFKMPWRNYELHDWMSEEYKYIEGKYVKLSGFPCSWTFYHHIREEILQEFTFHDFIRDETNKYLEQVKGTRKNATFIGVHVRRGDYVNIMPNIWKGVVADKTYLEKAMSYFRNKYQEPVFVVTSNGMEWCKKNIDASSGDVYFSEDGVESSPGKDFALLAHCNHTIMTIGTFGYWVGYLAGGETIYLTNFTLPDSRFLKLFHYDAAFLPEWIGIPADLSPLRNDLPWNKKKAKY